jgi:DNA-binding transcriptional ArsR family regulator
MVDHYPSSDESLGLVFGALADPTRRSILSRLRDGRSTISAVAEPFEMSLAAVSKHVQVLERAGLVRREVQGREHFVSLDAAPLRDATEWTLSYRDFWNERLDALDRVLRGRSRGRSRGKIDNETMKPKRRREATSRKGP